MQRLKGRLAGGLRALLVRHPRIVKFIERRDPLAFGFSRFLIEMNAGYGMPRPRPLSLRGPYTSWYGLHDRSFTGRQLGPDTGTRTRPPVEDVEALFARPAEGMIYSARTSLLFAYVAQWFTDSFVRSMPESKPQHWRRNSSNHDIDLCQVYGATDEATKALRMHDGTGRLRFSNGPDGAYPPLLLKPTPTGGQHPFADPDFAHLYDPDRLKRALSLVPSHRLPELFATGLEQGNATPGNLVLTVVFLRAHNHVAGELKREYPNWSGDRIFETTRNVMIAIFMQIVLGDYIRHISPIDFPFRLDPNVGEKKRWKRWNRINVEFGLLYRWHPLMPDITRVGNQCFTIQDTLWNPGLVTSGGIAPLITAASRQRAGKLTLGNTPDFFLQQRQMLIGGGMRSSSIQRKTIEMARRADLQPYNAYREEFGLPRVTSFRELTGERDFADRLEALYDGKIDDLEWFVGLFAEAHGEKMVMGELMLRMVAFDAFTHIFGNPLVSPGVYNVETFSELGMELIETAKTLDKVVAWAVPSGAKVHVSFDYTR